VIEPNGYFFGAQEITGSSLVVGPPDAENQVYDAGDAPYALGDEVWRAGHVFRSLIDANSDDTAVALSWDDLGEVDKGALLWTAGTYAENVFKVLSGRVWKSAKASNTTTPGDTSTPELADDWTDAGPTNRFKAFDLKSNLPALLDGEITWVFETPWTINTMLLVLPRGGRAFITVTDTLGEEVFDEEYRLTRDSGGGPYNHDFSPIDSVSRLIVFGLPPGTGNTVKVRITGSAGQLVGTGQIAMGFSYDLGTVVVGSSTGVSSFKDAVEDEFGNVVFPDRPVRRVVRFKLVGPIRNNDNTLTRVAQYLNKPAGMFMTDGVDYGLCAFGLVQEVELPMDNSVLTDATIEMKGFAE